MGAPVDEKRSRGHCVPVICLMAGAAFMYLLAGTFKILSVFNTESVFGNSSLPVVDMTPAVWVFRTMDWWTWVFQGLLLVYALSTIPRRTVSLDSYLYLSPLGIPCRFFPLYIAHMVLNIGRMFVFRSENQLWTGFTLQVFMFLTTLAMIILIFRNYDCENLSCANRADITLRFILLHNGMAMYASWQLFETLLSFAASLVYSIPNPTTDRIVSIFFLCVLMVIILVWFPLEVTVLRKKLAGTHLHYWPLFFASVGLIHIHPLWNPVVGIAITNLILVVVFYLLNMVLSCLGCSKGRNCGEEKGGLCQSKNSGRVTPENASPEKTMPVEALA